MVRDPDDETSTLTRTRDLIAEQKPLDPELLAQFQRVIAAHRPKILRVCRRIVCNDELAEEITQETLLVAMRKLSTFEGKSQMSTWLCGIARHLALNAVRKKGEPLTEDGIFEIVSPEASALRTLSKKERDAVLIEASARILDKTQQEIVRLRYIENLEHRNIESILGLSTASGARGALQTIHRQLKAALTEKLEEMGIGPSTYVGRTS